MKLNFVELYNSGFSVQKITKITGVNKYQVTKVLKEYGVYRVSEKLAERYALSFEEKQQIIQEYLAGETKQRIAIKYKHGESNIKRILQNAGIKIIGAGVRNRKYAVNHDYFENIDSEDKAYFLGFMYADGYNRQVHGQKSMTLNLAIKDISVIESLREKVCPDKKLYINYRSLKNPNWQDSVCLSVQSVKLSDDLAKWGCVQAKTHILTFPENLDPNFYRHFIRGYFDGDGYCNPKRFDLIGTIPFLERVQEILMKELNLNKTKLGRRHKDREDTIRTLIYGGTHVTKRIYEYLYKDAEYFLERKKLNFNIT